MTARSDPGKSAHSYWSHGKLLTGLGLATAAGLNAYIPMLVLGLLSRFTDLVNLPHGWTWLENGWVLAIVAVLLIVEIVADKIPALDSVNDAVQTFVRPDGRRHRVRLGHRGADRGGHRPRRVRAVGQWIPVAIGVVVALVVSLTKTDGAPGGQRRDRGSGGPGAQHARGRHQFRAGVRRILLPVLVLVAVVALVWAAVAVIRRRRRPRAARGPTR